MGFRIQGLPRQAFAHLIDQPPEGLQRHGAEPAAAHLHAHYAKRGCCAARVERASR